MVVGPGLGHGPHETPRSQKATLQRVPETSRPHGSLGRHQAHPES